MFSFLFVASRHPLLLKIPNFKFDQNAGKVTLLSFPTTSYNQDNFISI